MREDVKEFLSLYVSFILELYTKNFGTAFRNLGLL